MFAAAVMCVGPSASHAQREDPRRVIKIITVDSQGPAGSGLKAAKTDTGEFRTPTAEEEAALAKRGPNERDTVVLLRADGSVTALLGDEHMDDVVAVRNADGSITTTHAPHGTELPAAPALETE